MEKIVEKSSLINFSKIGVFNYDYASNAAKFADICVYLHYESETTSFERANGRTNENGKKRDIGVHGVVGYANIVLGVRNGMEDWISTFPFKIDIFLLLRKYPFQLLSE